MSDDTTVPDDNQSLEFFRAQVQHLQEREAFFATALRVADGGQYRNDWPGAVERMIRENEALRAQVAAHEDADRRWSADMEALRDTLNAATSRLEAYGAIAHVVVGYDDGPVDTVIAACAELPFVRIENKRLQDELAELRRELQAERDCRARMIADLDARSGEPL